MLTSQSAITYNNRRQQIRRPLERTENSKKKISIGSMGLVVLVVGTLLLAGINLYAQGNFSEITYEVSQLEKERSLLQEQIKACQMEVDSLEQECFVYKKAEQFLGLNAPTEEQVVLLSMDQPGNMGRQVAKAEDGTGTWSKFFLGLSKNPAYLGMRN